MSAEPSSAEEILRTGIYFEGKMFIPSRLAEGLRKSYPTATGGRRLYVFRNGIYRPSEDFLRHEITTRLGSKVRPSSRPKLGGDRAVVPCCACPETVCEGVRSPGLDELEARLICGAG